MWHASIEKLGSGVPQLVPDGHTGISGSSAQTVVKIKTKKQISLLAKRGHRGEQGIHHLATTLCNTHCWWHILGSQNRWTWASARKQTLTARGMQTEPVLEWDFHGVIPEKSTKVTNQRDILMKCPNPLSSEGVLAYPKLSPVGGATHIISKLLDLMIRVSWPQVKVET